MRLIIGLIYLLYGTDGDVPGSDNVMLHHVLRNNTFNNTSSNENGTGPIAAPVVDKPYDGTGGDGTDKSIFMLGILVSFCIVAVLGVVVTVICWVRIFSAPKKAGKECSEFKSKDAENLDKRNMRDVQLTEYEKRKRQMKELDNQQEEVPENGVEESDNDGELDEITAVQSQPLEEETIVNPHFMHHYVPIQGSR